MHDVIETSYDFIFVMVFFVELLFFLANAKHVKWSKYIAIVYLGI